MKNMEEWHEFMSCSPRWRVESDERASNLGQTSGSLAEPARPRQTCVPLPLPPLARGRLVQLSKRLACRRATASRLRSDRGRRGGVRLSPKGYAREHFPGRPPRAAHAHAHMAGWVHWRRAGIGAGASASPRHRKGCASANRNGEAFRRKAKQDRNIG
jgi:hypothetical protein